MQLEVQTDSYIELPFFFLSISRYRVVQLYSLFDISRDLSIWTECLGFHDLVLPTQG